MSFYQEMERGDSSVKQGASRMFEENASIEEIAKLLPTFTSQDFAVTHEKGTTINPRLMVIVRQGLSKETPPMPIATVSKSYELVQHHTVLRTACDALDRAGINLNKVSVNLRMTELGEQVSLSFLLPKEEDYLFRLDGDDDHMRLRLRCFNSVDRSLRFMAYLDWFRMVCTNGLMMWSTHLAIRRRHCPYLNVPEIGKLLSTSMKGIVREKNYYSKWLKIPIDEARLREWVDGPLRKHWGVRLAARTLHIARTGYDADFAKPFEPGRPSEKSMKQTRQVPGAWVPAQHVFAVSQVLAWLAKERHDIQDQIELTTQIHDVIQQLLEK